MSVESVIGKDVSNMYIKITKSYIFRLPEEKDIADKFENSIDTNKVVISSDDHLKIYTSAEFGTYEFKESDNSEGAE